MTAPRRAGRRTNLALLAVLPVAFATGWLAFATGTPWPARVVTAVHAAAGFAVLLLVPWKQLIVRRGLMRRGPARRSPRQRGIAAQERVAQERMAQETAAQETAAQETAAQETAGRALATRRIASPGTARRSRRLATKALSIALGLLVLVSIAAGLTHSHLGPHRWFGLSTMQVHVGAALAAVPLFVVHVLTRRPYLRRTDLSRRNALRLGALAGAAAVTVGLTELIAAVTGLPGRTRRATGSFDIAAGPIPQVAWLFDEVPNLDTATYTVTVNGRRIPYADLAAAPDEVRAVLDCTSGWYTEQTWRGTRVDRLLGGMPNGTVVVTSATGYQRRFPGAEADSLWLVTHIGDTPIDPGHGAPARLVAPGRRGFWWVKWVTSIEVQATQDWWQAPFPI